MTKPEKPRWADGDPSYVIEPAGSKKDTGWLSGEKPPYQYMNWLHKMTNDWVDWFEDRLESESHLTFRSNHPVYWSGTALTFSANIVIAFRNGASPYINQIAAGSISLSDGQVVVARLDKTNATPVTLALQATYGNLAEGEYCVVSEASLSEDNDNDEIILFRRRDVASGSDAFGVGYKALEMPLVRQIAFDGESFMLGSITSSPASIPPLKPGAYNLGLKLNAGELKIVSANGTSLSDYNVGWVVMASQVTDGEIVRIRVTDDTHLFVDDSGASDIVGEEFGRTTGVAWGDTFPFIIYAVNADDTETNLRFAHSPNPTAYISPATANIGYHGNPGATPSDENFFFWTASDPTTTHDAVPCLAIGTFAAIMSASDDWTVSTLSEIDGISKFNYKHREFEMSSGQMGAASGKFFKNNGGTAPAFAASSYRRFKLYEDGQCDFFFAFQSGTTGSGAVNAQIASPYKCYTATGTVEARYEGSGRVSNNGGYTGLASFSIVEGTTTVNIVDDAGASVQYDDFGAVDNNVFGTIRFQAFGASF